MPGENLPRIQPPAGCIGERCSSTEPTRLATAVVCHPDTGQNRPTKSPDPAGDLLHRKHRKRELYQCATPPGGSLST